MKLKHENCIQRREGLLSRVQADTILISNPRHVQYFCGYWASPLQLGSWGTPHLIINSSTGHTTLLSHNFAADPESAFVDSVRTWHW